MILETLIYDGKVEKSVIACAESSSASGQMNIYRSVEPLVPVSPVMHTPCGICPVFNSCHPGGAISPQTCIYMKDWLDLWLMVDFSGMLFITDFLADFIEYSGKNEFEHCFKSDWTLVSVAEHRDKFNELYDWDCDEIVLIDRIQRFHTCWNHGRWVIRDSDIW